MIALEALPVAGENIAVERFRLHERLAAAGNIAFAQAYKLQKPRIGEQHAA